MRLMAALETYPGLENRPQIDYTIRTLPRTRGTSLIGAFGTYPWIHTWLEIRFQQGCIGTYPRLENRFILSPTLDLRTGLYLHLPWTWEQVYIGTYPGLGDRSHGRLEPELQGLKALRIVLVHEFPVRRSHETSQLGVGRRFPDNRRRIISRAEAPR